MRQKMRQSLFFYFFSALILLLLFELSNLDFLISNLVYNLGIPHHFIGRDTFLFDVINHKYSKKISVIFPIVTLFLLIISYFRPFYYLKQYKKSYWFLLLCFAVIPLTISILKKTSHKSCPKDLIQYGGTEIYTNLFEIYDKTQENAGCFPGGHASDGFSLIAFYWLWRKEKPKQAKYALIAALIWGNWMAIGQVLRGDHFLSHGLWTLWFAAVICECFYYLLFTLKNNKQEIL